MTADWFIGISYVGGREYLDRALDSLGAFRDHAIIVNSSGTWLDIPGEAFLPVPLTHTQTHNWIRRRALQCGISPFYMVMHADAEASDKVVDVLADRVRTLTKQDSKWAVLFTNYDALAAYSTAAAIEVGEWDWQLFPSYYSDNDYHRRCQLAGYALIDTGLPVKHEGSHVINKVDKWRKLYTRLQMDHWRDLYIQKWGGDSGKETFKTPFGIDPKIGPYPDGDD